MKTHSGRGVVWVCPVKLQEAGLYINYGPKATLF